MVSRGIWPRGSTRTWTTTMCWAWVMWCALAWTHRKKMIFNNTKNEGVVSNKLLVSTRGVYLWTASNSPARKGKRLIFAARCLPSSIRIQKWPGWERVRRCWSRKVCGTGIERHGWESTVPHGPMAPWLPRALCTPCGQVWSTEKANSPSPRTADPSPIWTRMALWRWTWGTGPDRDGPKHDAHAPIWAGFDRDI